MSDLPVFAVVGHPNKGKSSIVSTLAGDDSVRIGADPGTTVRCRRYPMKVDGVPLYELVDTPGFQRARRALNWMMELETTAAEHAGVVRRFVERFRPTGEFPDECELLAPLIAGAGILYVVDGSVPYGPEYEAEMKILRWTGRPSMGLINPIGPADHTAEWTAALHQYFSVVRVFDAVRSSFAKRTELLKAFGQLRDEWRVPLDSAVESLLADRARRRARAARVLAETIAGMMALQIDGPLPDDEDDARAKAQWERKYLDALCGMEASCRDRIEELYDHHRLERRDSALAMLDAAGLFSKQTWQVFGLNRLQVLGLGAIGGGTIGGMIDASTGGASLLLGTLIGSGIGATAGLLAARRIAEVKILNIPLGGRRLVVGPARNVNFPHVVFNRARLHHALIAGRTHAERNALLLSEGPAHALPPLSPRQRHDLERNFSRIRRGWNGHAAQDQLQQTMESILSEDDRRAAGEPDP